MKPCLVIGSGFHSRVLGSRGSPLSSWDALIEEVASELNVCFPPASLSPVLRWERILETAASDGFQHPLDSTKWFSKASLAIHEVEQFAKQAVKKVIDGCGRNYPYRSSKAQYPFDPAFAAVISLNFDHCWVGHTNFTFDNTKQGNRSGGLTEVEAGRLMNYIQSAHSPDMRIWFPNGSICEPNTIRMGLYDYGAQAHSLKIAFDQLKAFERNLEARLGADGWDKKGPVIEEELSKDTVNQDPAFSNWVAQFLYRPIYFAGVGLSEAETGLWWLLAQRARNLARISASERPETVLLLHAQDERRGLWANRPCGIEAMYCDEWDHGWEMLLDRAGPQVISGGSF